MEQEELRQETPHHAVGTGVWVVGPEVLAAEECDWEGEARFGESVAGEGRDGIDESCADKRCWLLLGGSFVVGVDEES